MRKILFFLVFIQLVSSGAAAGIHIYEPKDELITYDEVLTLRGLVRDPENLKVNGLPLKFDSRGLFTCGLVLQVGKNLVDIRALDQRKDSFIERRRILRLKTFEDMEILYEDKQHWARQQIINLATLGYIEGYPDDNYYPSNPISRGELATWLARIKGLNIPALTRDVFFDVPREHWRAPYIKVVVDTGLMKSYDAQLFGIDDPVSRREAAGIAVIAEGLEVVDKFKPFFIDVLKEEAGANTIYLAREKGLVKGIFSDVPVYDPDRAITRAEAAVLLARFERSIGENRSLFDFNMNFSKDNYCRLNVAPEIVTFAVEPKRIPRLKKSGLKVRVEIGPRANFSPIAKVKLDLSEIGGSVAAEMFDDGTNGDETKDDLVYSLNIYLEPEVHGSKALTVTAIDDQGWESKKQVYLQIRD
ncbi:S-layer homology domain-containing protein [Candidatus Margulisiibacteriota bacterium]